MILLDIPFPPLVLTALMLIVVLMAAIFDLRHRKIPNWLSVSGLIAALVTHLILGGLPGLWSSLGGFGAAFTLYFVLYILHAMGAGDVKIMAAVGAIAGIGWWFLILILTFLTGAVLGIFLAISKGRLRTTIWNTAYLARELISFRLPWLTRKELDVKNPSTLRLPHGLSIAIGAVLSLILLGIRHVK